ncbi:MAG: elongation factor G, partial [Planctomycetes bacterium]|nr:elongation factor G [Planctomycetota bacterium]
ESGGGLQFENKVVGGRIPKEYIPAIRRGVVDAMAEGPYAGYPMVDVKVVVFDGSAHDVDSSEQAFRTCGRQGFREACRKAGMLLLEPVMSVEVTVPSTHTGGVTGSLGAKRGRIIRLDAKNDMTVLRAEVPLEEMFGYASEIRTLTSGLGEFTMHFERYQAVPLAQAEKIAQARKEAGK